MSTANARRGVSKNQQEAAERAFVAYRTRSLRRVNGKYEIVLDGSKIVPWIPCTRCKGEGRVALGKDEFGGSARCGACQGKKILTAEDVLRNVEWNRQQMSKARLEAVDITAQFTKMYELAKEIKPEKPTPKPVVNESPSINDLYTAASAAKA